MQTRLCRQLRATELPRVPCGARRRRDGQPCEALSVPGKQRCRMARWVFNGPAHARGQGEIRCESPTSHQDGGAACRQDLRCSVMSSGPPCSNQCSRSLRFGRMRSTCPASYVVKSLSGETWMARAGDEDESHVVISIPRRQKQPQAGHSGAYSPSGTASDLLRSSTERPAQQFALV